MTGAGRGFTLVEMSLVLAIMSVLLGGGMVVLSAQRQADAWRTAQAQLEDAKEALMGYAVVHGRLPRPTQAATDGLERATPCTNDSDCTGFLPWASLGLPKGDPWGKLLRYSVSPKYAGGETGSSNIDLLGAGLESKTVTALKVGDATSLSPMSASIPAVVFSQGAKNQGTGVEGAAIADASGNNQDEDTNHAATQTFVFRLPADAAHPRGEFDDIVVWLSPYLIKSRLMQAGRVF